MNMNWPLIIAILLTIGLVVYTLSSSSKKKCATGYVLVDNNCVKIGNVCSLSSSANTFTYNTDGKCVLTSCIQGYEPKDGICVSSIKNEGDVCNLDTTEPGVLNYLIDADGKCTIPVCDTGSGWAMSEDNKKCERLLVFNVSNAADERNNSRNQLDSAISVFNGDKTQSNYDNVSMATEKVVTGLLLKNIADGISPNSDIVIKESTVTPEFDNLHAYIKGDSGATVPKMGKDELDNLKSFKSQIE